VYPPCTNINHQPLIQEYDLIIWTPAPSPALCLQTQNPTTTTTTTSFHRPPLLFHMVHLKPSHRAQFRWIWPLGPSPTSRLQTQSPTITITLSTSSHHLSPLPSTAVLHSTPKTEPSHSVSWVLAPQSPLLPHVCERRAPPPPPPQPHNHTTSPHCPPSPFHTAHPKSSHCARFRGIWHPAPLSCLVFANVEPFLSSPS
jgi:hypothetical protein